MATLTAVETSPAPTPSHRLRNAVVLIAGAVLIAALAFLAGQHHRPAPTVLTGVATVGDHEASVPVQGYVYGIMGVEEWIDQQGALHVGGWPACLAPAGRTVRIKFAETPTTGPDGSPLRQVVWVDCRA
jgi:hypothetical protein